MNKITIQCKSCKGTGIFKGMAERGNAGVICHTCNGKGSVEFEYEDFVRLIIRDDIARVYEGHGFCITDNDIYTEEGNLIRFSEGGCTYGEWLSGIKPKPIKDLYCPYIYDNRGIGDEPLPRCREGLKKFGSITNCIFYDDKETCWEMLERQNGK